jgi:hypothetical protein
MMYQGDSPRVCRRHIIARLDVHDEAAHDAEDPGLEANTTAAKMFNWFGVIDDAERVKIKHQTEIDPCSDEDRQPSSQ